MLDKGFTKGRVLMAKYKVADFGFVIYKDGDKVDVAFRKAKKVPKAYDSFVATLELACLAQIQQFMRNVEKGQTDGKNGE